MLKKLSLMLTAVAVLAFAVPSLASASQVTSKTGVTAPIGSVLRGTGTDVTLTSSTLGEVTCEKLNLIGTLNKNDGTTVEGSGSAEKPVQEKCKNGSKSVTVTSVTLTKLFSTGTGHTGTATFDATIDIGPEPLECTFTGTNVPFTYVPGSDIIKFASAAGITSSPAACGTAKLDGEFTLEIESTAVILD